MDDRGPKGLRGGMCRCGSWSSTRGERSETATVAVHVRDTAQIATLSRLSGCDEHQRILFPRGKQEPGRRMIYFFRANGGLNHSRGSPWVGVPM